MNILGILGRKEHLFKQDISKNEQRLSDIISLSKFLVIGAAGSIGQAVTKEIFKRNPKALHAVDISENNLVELVRSIRSSFGYGSGDFRTFAIDCGGVEFHSLINIEGPYDYIFNLSALKHVRSEKDPFTLMRLVNVNILNTISILEACSGSPPKNYFCISTDKAANPVNMMGASKKIMEQFLMKESLSFNISMARFANVAFSDGSLLHGFNQRLIKRQPISAPNDVKRYFITPQESGELCLLAGLFGDNRDIFFPKLNSDLQLETFPNIALRFLEFYGFTPVICQSEEEARETAEELISSNKWPVYFFESNTSGEKSFEEFFTENERLNLSSFEAIGIIKNKADFNEQSLNTFLTDIAKMRKRGFWDKQEILTLFHEIIPNFEHKETGKYLDDRM